MNVHRSPKIALSILLATIAVGLLAGCAGTQDPWGDPESGLIMTYRMPEAQTLKYTVAFDQTHTLTAMGQERSFGNGRTFDFSTESAGSADENLHMTITIDAMTLMLGTAQGMNELDVQKIREQSFDLTVSPRGEVLDTGTAAEVTYFLGGAGEQGIDADFGDFFPGLPEGPVKVGDTWSYEGGIPGNSFNPETSIRMTSVNTFEGLETIDGLECAKITATFTGELVTEGDSSPGTAISGGPVEGSGVWYFAYKEGFLVKADRTVRARTEIAMTGPGGPPVPALEETKIEIGLVTKVAG
jgi:hypothetical protein